MFKNLIDYNSKRMSGLGSKKKVLEYKNYSNGQNQEIKLILYLIHLILSN